jgi:hypothetical protein
MHPMFAELFMEPNEELEADDRRRARRARRSRRIRTVSAIRGTSGAARPPADPRRAA